MLGHIQFVMHGLKGVRQFGFATLMHGVKLEHGVGQVLWKVGHASTVQKGPQVGLTERLAPLGTPPLGYAGASPLPGLPGSVDGNSVLAAGGYGLTGSPTWTVSADSPGPGPQGPMEPTVRPEPLGTEVCRFTRR